MTDQPARLLTLLRSRQVLLQTHITIVTLAGAAVLVACVISTSTRDLLGDYPVLFGGFSVLLLAAELKPMTYHADDGEVTASWTFAFALLFIAPMSSGLIVASSCAFIADLIRSKALVRAMFNASQFALSLGAGMVAGNEIENLLNVAEGEALDLRWLAAAVVAWAVSFALNSVIISVVIALHQAVPVVEMLLRSLKVILGMDGVLLALSPIFLVVGIESPILVPLLLGTVALIFRSATVALSNRHEATHDQLTNIPNRRLFQDHFDLTLESARRTSEQVALVHIDLDGFKGINDRLGHHYGDEVLRTIATRLVDFKRPVDFVARLGGDEFVVTLGSLHSRNQAERIARDIWTILREPMDVEGVPLAIDASLGVAVYPDDGQNLHTLLNHADMAMYRAKQEALGVQLHSGEHAADGPNSLHLITDLPRGIAANELELYYQPKVDTPSGTITGVEALVRWNHPQYGVVEPAWFIPQAEQTELIMPLTDRVLELAIRQCRAWLDEGIRATVSVNASARNLHDLKLPERVAAMLTDAGLDAGWLELEITENAVMSDPVRAAAVISRLRAIGVKLAIDDFGTGYSSLVSLRNLTIDRIKIDKSFIAAMADSDDDVTIVRSVIDLGKALGVVVVAEGVESEAVYAIVRDLGCDEFQGFLVAEPVPADVLLPMLHAQGAAAARNPAPLTFAP